MEVGIGDYIEVQTQTLEDTFGVCIFKIAGPEVQGKDGPLLRCVLVQGSGPSAEPGHVVYDSLGEICRNIADGITRVLTADEAAQYEDMA